MGMARGGGQEVVGSHDLLDPLGGVVDDDDEVVGGGAVAAAEHQGVDHASVRSVAPVDDLDGGMVGAEPERRRPPRCLALGPLRGPEVAAGARIVPGGQVGRGGRFADLAPRAPAPVGQSGPFEVGQGVLVEGEPVGLPYRVAVPVEPELLEIAPLVVLVVAASRRPVEILESQEMLRTGRAGEQPRRQCRAQVAHVEAPRRAGCESSPAHPPILT